MIHVVIGGTGAPFTWIDVVEPTRAELIELAGSFGLHLTSVEDSLEPDHLPKHELIGDTQFMILRAYDEAAGPTSVTTQQLTRKLALFIADKVVISIHRKDQGCFVKVRDKWTTVTTASKARTLTHVVNDLMRCVIDSFDRPIAGMQGGLTTMESQIFQTAGTGGLVLQDGYTLRRRASVFRYMLQLTSDIISEYTGSSSVPKADMPLFRDLQEKSDRLAFYADDLRENIDHLLNLHVSLAAQATNKASHRVNEVMRLLTVFSAFFLPLNFIASIYGMNFQYMPELASPHGYHITLGVMASVAAGIFLWFKSRGWLKPEEHLPGESNAHPTK